MSCLFLKKGGYLSLFMSDPLGPKRSGWVPSAAATASPRTSQNSSEVQEEQKVSFKILPVYVQLHEETKSI